MYHKGHWSANKDENKSQIYEKHTHVFKTLYRCHHHRCFHSTHAESHEIQNKKKTFLLFNNNGHHHNGDYYYYGVAK